MSVRTFFFSALIGAALLSAWLSTSSISTKSVGVGNFFFATISKGMVWASSEKPPYQGSMSGVMDEFGNSVSLADGFDAPGIYYRKSSIHFTGNPWWSVGLSPWLVSAGLILALSVACVPIYLIQRKETRTNKTGAPTDST